LRVWVTTRLHRFTRENKRIQEKFYFLHQLDGLPHGIFIWVNTKGRIGKKMLDEYYRNGELFIAEPVIEFLGHSDVSEGSAEEDIIRLFRKYFEVSGNVKKKVSISIQVFKVFLF